MRDRLIWKNRWLAKPQELAMRRDRVNRRRPSRTLQNTNVICLSRPILPEGSVEFTLPADLTIDNWSIQGNNRH